MSQSPPVRPSPKGESTVAESSVAPRTPRVFELARCALTVLSGSERGREHIIDRDVFRIGKSEENDFILTDTTVSRAHCEIVREAKGFLLRDRDSTNGTLLDGAEIKEAWLKPGGVITVGKVEIKVRPFTERVEVVPSQREELVGLVGTSALMRIVFSFMERLAKTDTNVLFEGEPGSGKASVARGIHLLSSYRDAPFVVIDCATLFGTAGESELFGHERGAFPGALTIRVGALEQVRVGTLFLRNINDLPLDLQPRVLRVLEQRMFRKLGSSKDQRFEGRVFASTSKKLEVLVLRGTFHNELMQRLSGTIVDVPALRSRPEDTRVVVHRMLRDIATKLGKHELSIRNDTLAVLSAHEWPGNVSELRQVIERAARAAYERKISNLDIPLGGSAESFEFDPAQSYRETRAKWETSFEKAYVTWLLSKHRGNISAASRSADMDRKYLHKLAKKHGIERSDNDLKD